MRTALTPAFDYREVHVWRETATGLLPLSLAGCLQTVDLRAPLDADLGGDPACAVGERVDPTAGTCAPCVYVDPDTVCPCGFTAAPAPFPACEGPYGTFTCHAPCEGNITTCTAFAEVGGFTVATDCALLRACCDDLAQSPVAQPCCPSDESLLCFVGTGEPPYPYLMSCVSTTCCASECLDDLDCDTTFQTCQDDRCVPGCDTAREICLIDGEQCECRVSSPL